MAKMRIVGRTVEVAREMNCGRCCHEDIGMASELNVHFDWDWARGYVLCRSQFISGPKTGARDLSV